MRDHDLDYPICNTQATRIEAAPLAEPRDGRVQICTNPALVSRFPDFNPESGSPTVGIALEPDWSGYITCWALIPRGRYIGEELIVLYEGEKIAKGDAPFPIRLALAIAGYRSDVDDTAPQFVAPDGVTKSAHVLSKVDSAPGLWVGGTCVMILRWVPNRWVIVAKTENFTFTDSAFIP